MQKNQQMDVGVATWQWAMPPHPSVNK